MHRKSDAAKKKSVSGANLEEDYRYVVVDIDASGIIDCAQYCSRREAENDEAFINGNGEIMTQKQFNKFIEGYKKLFR